MARAHEPLHVDVLAGSGLVPVAARHLSEHEAPSLGLVLGGQRDACGPHLLGGGLHDGGQHPGRHRLVGEQQHRLQGRRNGGAGQSLLAW